MIWQDIKGFEGLYQVSTCGNIKSLRSNRILIPVKDKKGYFRVSLYPIGLSKRKSKQVHRLVAETYLDNHENKPQVNHVNGIKANNKVNNLEWVTSSENCLHAHRTGLASAYGECNGRSKIKHSTVAAIKSCYKHGLTQYQIGELYGLSQSHVSRIIRGVYWSKE